MDTCKNLLLPLLDRWKVLYTKIELEQLGKALSTKPLPSFRTNTLKISSDALTKTLQEQGFKIEKVNWYADAFMLKNKSIRELTETETYKKGFVYIQNLSSM